MTWRRVAARAGECERQERAGRVCARAARARRRDPLHRRHGEGAGRGRGPGGGGERLHRLARDARRPREDAAPEDPRRPARPARRPEATASRWPRNDIRPIDMVVVNLYPFEATVARPDCTLEEAIENIDIGGPSMMRSAAKNHRDVTVVVDPADYAAVLAEMRSNGGGRVRGDQRAPGAQGLRTARRATTAPSPTTWAAATARRAQALRRDPPPRPAQGAGPALRREPAPARGALRRLLRRGRAAARQGAVVQQHRRHQRRAVADAGVSSTTAPTVAILKHNTPCGVGTGRRVAEAYRRAFATDPESPFGGILIANQTWTWSWRRWSTRSSPRC